MNTRETCVVPATADQVQMEFNHLVYFDTPTPSNQSRGMPRTIINQLESTTYLRYWSENARAKVTTAPQIHIFPALTKCPANNAKYQRDALGPKCLQGPVLPFARYIAFRLLYLNFIHNFIIWKICYQNLAQYCPAEWEQICIHRIQLNTLNVCFSASYKTYDEIIKQVRVCSLTHLGDTYCQMYPIMPRRLLGDGASQESSCFIWRWIVVRRNPHNEQPLWPKYAENCGNR